MQINRRIAFWFLVGCALLWSTGGFLIKSINLSPLAISGGRSIIAALFLTLVHGRPRFVASPVFLGAAFAYAGTLTSFVTATRLTTAADAILLQYTAPVFVLLFGWLLLKERVTRVDLAVTILVMAGLVVFFLESLSGDTSATAMAGNALGVLSGVFFGLQAVLMRKVRLSGMPVESVLILGNLICFVIAIPALTVSRPDSMDLLWLTLLGVVQIGFAYLLYMAALRYVTSLELILVPVIEPVVNPLIVFLLRGEKPGLLTIAGGVFILGIVTAWCLYRARQPQAALPDQVDEPAVLD